ncbi:MAG TPA: DeoR/GlpR transcriptional regulator [Treponema sp.]|nr:DeoR/GlpR transcriptional regulator [Treponema sp.]
MEIEREQYILNQIQAAGTVQVEELAQELGVSLMTIRRDLSNLKEKGLIERCHGGAILKQEVPYSSKIIANSAEKNKIAQTAMRYIHKNDTVFLDAGTTTYHIANWLLDRDDLTIVTDDLQIACLLAKSNMQVFICGGYIQKNTGCVMGTFANQMIDNFCIDVAFVGAAAIDDQFNILTPTIEKIDLKRQIIKSSSQTYLVTGKDKFNKRAIMKINSAADYTGIITDMCFTEKEKQTLREEKITIISVQ